MRFVTLILAAAVAVGGGWAAPLGYDFSKGQAEPRRLDDVTVSITQNLRALFLPFPKAFTSLFVLQHEQ